MPRDADSPLQLGFLIKFVEPDRKPEEIETETQYLQDDLLDLSGMGQTRFHFLQAHREGIRFREGLRFDTAPDRLRPILRRLCDRLDDTPLETLILIYHGQTRLQIQTHRAEELASIVAAAEDLLPPESIYLAKAETYVRTRGDISPAEAANLDLLAQQLGLSPEEAKGLNEIAMGPYKSLDEKQQRFLEVLTIELSHTYPPTEDTHQVLQELAENLRLPKAEADRIYQAYLQKIQAEVAAQRQKDEAAAAAAKQQAEASAQVEQAQLHQVETQQQVEQYRELFRQAVQNHLYPLAFDQGRLEQSRQVWQISQDTASQIEAEVRDELYGSVTSAAGLDYTRLRQLLWSQDWLEADRETEQVILKAVSQDMQPIDRDALMRLPCVDLLTIDQLWSRHSHNKFGFRAQYQVFQEADRRPQDFQRTLAWRDHPISLKGELKPYKALTFALSASTGHLPTWRWCCPSLEGGYDISDALVEAFFLHLAKCLSVDSTPAPAIPWETPSGGA